MKTLLLMSVYSSIMIFFIIIIRSLFIHKLPKKVFKILWILTTLRLLLPFWINCKIDINSNIENTYSSESIISNSSFDSEHLIPIDIIKEFSYSNIAVNNDINHILFIVWLIGFVGMTLIFFTVYIISVNKYKNAVSINCPLFTKIVRTLRIRNPIELKSCSKVKSPLTYGIIHPKILLPTSVQEFDPEQMECILSHELIHIKNKDLLVKIIIIVSLCLHWFNPFVWIMFVLVNRDIELSCDEEVLNKCHINKKDYALTLIIFKESKNSLPVFNNFAKNAIEERIESIMKIKGMNAPTCIVAIFIICVITIVFAAKIEGNAINQDITEPVNVELGSVNHDETESVITQDNTYSVPISENNVDAFSNDISLPSRIESITTEYIYDTNASEHLNHCFLDDFSSPLNDLENKEIFYYGAYEIKANIGEQVFSMSDGKVLYSDYDYRFGNALIIDHGNDNIFLYANCNDVLVSVGEQVESGTAIAHVGDSGLTAEPRLLIYKIK